MPIRFDDIGNRLKAFRLGSGLSAEDLAAKLGISRTALYRFEKGELAKIETLEKLAELLQVSVPTLLGVGVEYIASAVSYFGKFWRRVDEGIKNSRRRELLTLERKRQRAMMRQRRSSGSKGTGATGLAETIWKPPEVN